MLWEPQHLVLKSSKTARWKVKLENMRAVPDESVSGAVCLDMLLTMQLSTSYRALYAGFAYHKVWYFLFYFLGSNEKRSFMSSLVRSFWITLEVPHFWIVKIAQEAQQGVRWSVSHLAGSGTNMACTHGGLEGSMGADGVKGTLKPPPCHSATGASSISNSDIP